MHAGALPQGQAARVGDVVHHCAWGAAGGGGHKWSAEAGPRRWKHSDRMGAKAQVGGGPQGPGGPALGAEAAVDAVVLAELGALRVGAGVRAG